MSWGTGDSVTLEGVKANKVTASMFVFEDPTAAATAAAATGAWHGGGQSGDMAAPADFWG